LRRARATNRGSLVKDQSGPRAAAQAFGFVYVSLAGDNVVEPATASI
jgi:hypothetical protein